MTVPRHQIDQLTQIYSDLAERNYEVQLGWDLVQDRFMRVGEWELALERLIRYAKHYTEFDHRWENELEKLARSMLSTDLSTMKSRLK